MSPDADSGRRSGRDAFHAQTVRNYIRGGKLPAYRLAGERFIRVLRRDLPGLLEPVAADDRQEEELDLPVNLSTKES